MGKASDKTSAAGSASQSSAQSKGEKGDQGNAQGSSPPEQASRPSVAHAHPRAFAERMVEIKHEQNDLAMALTVGNDTLIVSRFRDWGPARQARDRVVGMLEKALDSFARGNNTP